MFGIGGSFAVAGEFARGCAWLATHGLAIDPVVLSVLSRPCPPPPTLEWRTEATYQSLIGDQKPLATLYAGPAVAGRFAIDATHRASLGGGCPPAPTVPELATTIMTKDTPRADTQPRSNLRYRLHCG